MDSLSPACLPPPQHMAHPRPLYAHQPKAVLTNTQTQQSLVPYLQSLHRAAAWHFCARELDF